MGLALRCRAPGVGRVPPRCPTVQEAREGGSQDGLTCGLESEFLVSQVYALLRTAWKGRG